MQGEIFHVRGTRRALEGKCDSKVIGIKTKVPMSLLAVHQGPLAAARVLPQSLLHGPLHLQANKSVFNASHALNLPLPLL